MAVPHGHEAIKAERRIQHDLVGGGGQNRWQPARLARVGQQENDVVRRDELLKRVEGLPR